MARILIAGCGDVGTTLALNLIQSGHEVWGLKRNPDTLPPAICPLACDLTRPGSLLPLPPAIDYVFYTVAADGFSEDRYRAAYVKGVNNLVSTLSGMNQRPRRIIFTSSTSVYGQRHGEWVDEDTPARPAGFSGRCLREGEDLLWRAPYPATVIRFGGIYGPGRTRLIDTLREGTATCVEQPPVYTNRIHRDDCAGALQHLLEINDPAPLYLGVDDDPAPQCKVLRWLANQMGAAGPRVIDSSQASESRGNKRCRNTRLRASGFRFRYPSYRDGYQEMLAKKE